MSKKLVFWFVVAMLVLSTIACGGDVNWNSSNGQNATPSAAAPLTAGSGH